MTNNPMVKFSDIIEQDKQNFFNVKTIYKSNTLEELQEICRADSYDYAVCILNLTGDLNIGTMMRTSSIMGARKFIIFGRKKYDARSTVGAQNYIEVVRVDGLNNDLTINVPKFWQTMRDLNLAPFFVETHGETLGSFSWKETIGRINNMTPCFVFGNETYGIPQELHGAGPSIRIPQRGVLRSLNVSSACAIVLWDFVQNYYRRPK